MYCKENKDYLLTSECVSDGHPDKVADQISDCVLDMYLTHDDNARVAIECLVTEDNVVIAGEVSSCVSISKAILEAEVRKLIRNIGYNQPGFDWKTVVITNLIHQQSPDIAMGVNKASKMETGAGDQGVMYGFAIDEAPYYIPAPIYYAREILLNLKQAVKTNTIPQFGPDAKTQITLNYVNDIPVSAQSIVLSAQHQDNVSMQDIHDALINVIRTTLPCKWINPETKIFINPTGRFVIGGPAGDCGVTGRKIMIDTYGGHVPHGGGAFSGKDPTKVDRAAAYMARYIAKNVVASGLARCCLIQLSYAIGIATPLSINLDTFGTSHVDESRITSFITNNIDLSPYGIRKALNLSLPMYLRTATYGHFGREGTDEAFTWERTDLVEKIINEFSLSKQAVKNFVSTQL